MRVLYVEDNRINAILFEETLRMHGGAELKLAEDGREALEMVQDWLPELLVLDANLPDMTGFEVLSLLRQVPGLEQTPAIMCSANATPGDQRQAQDAGFVGYWSKPIHIPSVRADLDRLFPR
jgi:CheY-like chemotaxis protein